MTISIYDQINILKTLIREKDDRRDHRTLTSLQAMKDEVFATMDLVSSDFRNQSEAEREKLFDIAVREYLSTQPIDIDLASSLSKEGHPTWLTEERKKTIDDHYLNRYLSYLRKKGRSEKVVEEIEKSSLSIMEKLGDPKSTTPFFCKGLVVGSVQSGKTGNFNAVINRAVDCGYSLIIVFSGIMEDLRSQTQLRIEEDVIGEGTVDIKLDKKDAKGVGLVRKFGEQGDKSVAQLFPITSYKADFRKAVKDADFSLSHKNILVCKKNPGVLQNLLLWLHEHLPKGRDKHDLPCLIIDDEADNASLNNYGEKGRNYASKINGHIRALLELFTRKTYLGYTATPFANVLQDRNEAPETKWPVRIKRSGTEEAVEFAQVDNIFPDDFIVLLNPPSNYIGAKQLFETTLEENKTKIPLIKAIDDYHQCFPQKVVEENGVVRPATELDEKPRGARKTDPFPQELPGSLFEAVDCFILATALRLSRNSHMQASVVLNPHHTMLIHISRFTTWQVKTRDLVAEYVKDLQYKLETDMPAAPDSVYGKLEKAWNKNFAYIVENIKSHLPDDYKDEFLIPKSYTEIKSLLYKAASGIDVLAINSMTGDKLEYVLDAFGQGRKVIAVGGNRLSRGFTLEGLTINYFLRNTNFSDTLLQMGRWFGYRPGYIDCCRIFTTHDAIEKFDSTTRAIEELEIEFKKMEAGNKQPRDFVLRVRKHPGTLKITRPSILKNTKDVKWSYQDELVQTTKFRVDDARQLREAWDHFRKYFSARSQDIEVSDEFFTYHTDVDGLIGFLENRNCFHDFQDKEPMIQFLRICKEKDKMINWCIAIKRGGNSKNTLGPDQCGLPGDVRLSIRRGPENVSGNTWREYFKKGVFAAGGKSANIVSSGKDFALLLSEADQRNALKKFKDERVEYYMSKKGESLEEAVRNADKTTPPERIYREAMSDQQGLLVVYLMDIREVYRLNDPSDTDMHALFESRGIDKEVPLIGYAIGFPPISPDPGGEYKVGDYNISEDEGDEDPEGVLDLNDEDEN